MTQLLYYKNLCKEDLWLDCADKLTAMIQNIIEFAKLIPGFMRLSQDDQVNFLQQKNLPRYKFLIESLISLRFFSLKRDHLSWQ